MKTTGENLIVKVRKLKKYEEYGDTGLVVPTAYRKFHSDITIQDGTVEVPPGRTSDGRDVDIEEGDHVYVHHFAQEDQRRLDNSLFSEEDGMVSMMYDEIYCKKVDGEIVMVGQWNFLEPIEEDDEDITTQGGIQKKSKKDYKTMKGKLSYTSKDMEGYAEVGDTVLLKSDREYEIIIDGKMYYRVRSKDIIAKFEEND